MPTWLNLRERVFYCSADGFPIYGTVCEWWSHEDESVVHQVRVLWDNPPKNEAPSTENLWILYTIEQILDGDIFPA